MLFRGFDQVLLETPDFVEAFIAVSLKAAIIALIIGLVIGVVLGVVATSESKILRAISRIYVELLQNTPILILLFFLYVFSPYVVPGGVDAFTIGSIVLGIYHGAYISEIVRSGIEAVAKGQEEAAKSQGFTKLQTMRYIVLPQAIRMIIPPITTQVVGIIKNTSILQVIAVGDLMYKAQIWTSYSGFSGPAFILAALIYFVVCYPLTLLSRHLEKKFSRGYVRKPSKVKAQVKKVKVGGKVYGHH